MKVLLIIKPSSAFPNPLKTSPTETEFFFVEPDAKLTKVAPDGWKEDPKKRRSDVLFNLFLRIKFFHDDVNLIQ